MLDEEKKDYIQEFIYDLNDPQCAILEKDKLEYAIMKSLEKGLAEGRKEGYEQGILKDCLKVACPNCKPSIDNYCINCEYANFIIDKDNQIYKLEKHRDKLLKKSIIDFQKIDELENENAELKEALYNHPETASVTQLMELIQVREENEKLKAREKALGERVLQLEKDKGKLIDENRRLRCCGNCKHDIKPTTKESNLFCCECKKLDETKDNIILTKWEQTE